MKIFLVELPNGCGDSFFAYVRADSADQATELAEESANKLSPSMGYSKKHRYREPEECYMPERGVLFATESDHCQDGETVVIAPMPEGR